jgi:hypothetical protein
LDKWMEILKGSKEEKFDSDLGVIVSKDGGTN